MEIKNTLQPSNDNTKALLQLPVSALDIATRMKNKLNKEGVKTIADAIVYFDNTKFPIRGISNTTITSSIKYIGDFVDKNKSLNVEEIENLKDRRVSIIDNFDNLCEKIDDIAYTVISYIFHNGKDRNIDIINKRFGLNNNNKRTLQEIGDYYDLTRERVRQIEAKIIRTIRDIFVKNNNKKLKASSFFVERFNSIFIDINNQGNIVSERSFIEILEGKYGYSCSSENKLTLLFEVIGYEKLSDSINSPYLRSNPLYFCKNKISSKKISKIIYNIGILTKKPKEHDLFDIVVFLKRKGIKKLDNKDIINILNNSECISQLENKKYKTKINCLSSAADKAYSILFDANKSLHFSEIAKKINKHGVTNSDDVISQQNITNQMVQDKRFVPIGKSGRWGLSEWETIQNISSKDLMIKALHKNGKPMTAREIHHVVKQTRKRIPLKSVNTYLNTHKDIFVRVDRGVYGLTVWNLKKYSKKADNNPKTSLSIATKELFSSNKSFRFPDAVRQLSKVTGLSEVGIRQKLRNSELFKFYKASSGRGLIIECANKDFEKLYKHSNKKTLREKIQEEIRTVLYTNPNKEYLKGDLYKIIVEQVTCIRPTFYSYLSEMKDISTYNKDNRVYVMYKHNEEKNYLSVDFPTDNISKELSENLSRAISKLTIDEIDIGLFELGRIFEAELKSYLLFAKSNTLFAVSNKDLSSLVKMIECVVREKIIIKGYFLHILREERNARAHGNIPSANKRADLFNKAHYLVDKFIQYILFFHLKRI